MSYTLKSVKTFRGREGQGFNATLLHNGRAVAEVDDMANGGCYRWHWLAKDREQARADEAAFSAHVAAARPDLTFEAEDAFVSEMVEDISVAKQIARWCKSSVTFINGGQILRTKAAPSADVISFVAKKHPAAKILNGMPPAEALALVKAVSA